MIVDIDIIKEWTNRAYNDLITAQHVFNDMHPRQSEIACFLSQQCAEKALKGYLVSKDVEPEKVHKLEKLCDECTEYDTTFHDISSACQTLTPYAVAVRYPNQLAINDNKASVALDYAQRIYDFCMAKIPELNEMEQGERLIGGRKE
jgi:HEPN domain-containing protein